MRSLLPVLLAIITLTAPSRADISGVYEGSVYNPKRRVSFAVGGALTQVGTSVSGSLVVATEAGPPFADTFTVSGRVRKRKLILNGTGTSGAALAVRAKEAGAFVGTFAGRTRIRAGSKKLRGKITLELQTGSTTTTLVGSGTTTSTLIAAGTTTTSIASPGTTTTSVAPPGTTTTSVVPVTTTSSIVGQGTTTTTTPNPTTSSSTTTAPPQPTTTTSTTVPSGDLYIQNCYVCHGADARGDIGPNIRCNTNIAPTVKSGGIIMPPFNLTDPEIAAIQAYLNYLCSTGP